MMSTPILHIDMNAFFASVEVRERPELQGQPVLVGGDGRRGVVAAASYEARVFGIRSAMPSVEASRRCPHAVFLPGRHQLYQKVSSSIFSVFRDFTPCVEPLSLDEAFLDVRSVGRLYGDPSEIARQIREKVYETERLWCSIGLAASKSVAKLASEAAKPRIFHGQLELGSGIRLVSKSEERRFLDPLPVSALWGVGPRLVEKLARVGLQHVSDIAELPEQTLISLFGRNQSRHLFEMARGIDSRSVESGRSAKSISQEETFKHDIFDHTMMHSHVVRMADVVAHRLRGSNLKARTVSIKVRFGSFRTISRSNTISQATSNGRTLSAVAVDLLAKVDSDEGVRLLGISATGLTESGAEQLSFGGLAEPPIDETNGRVDEVVDEIRRRFGHGAIVPAAAKSAAVAKSALSEDRLKPST